MKYIQTSIATLASVAIFSLYAQAREQIKIVGSSTVYPFSSAVAEEFGAVMNKPTPVVESTGTGGGMKIFCSGNGLETPDITNASRKMKASEFDMCKNNGVTNIIEASIGFDGIVIAQNKKNRPLVLKREHLFLAIAEQVPSPDGKTLVKNPYTKWSQIDPSLPNRKISVYGPPKSSGTRDSFEEMVMIHATENNNLYVNNGFKKGYNKIRQDGAYIDSGENDNLIIQKLTKDINAIGIFGYSFLEENPTKINAAKIDGFEPTPENIASGKYPISRSLFFYIKKNHYAQINGLGDFVQLFMSEKMIGERGRLKKLGLIPASKNSRENFRKQVFSGKVMTTASFK